jgi:two-component system, OmpR family, phosphate regulon response regulator PhoB
MAQILIVDDDDIVADLASGMLIGDGHVCGSAASGEEALALLRVRRPDLLLLDNDMPGMNGPQVLRQLRNSTRDYDLPVIMLTSMTGQQDEEAALFNGAQDYIRKPFEARTLLHKVNLVLRSRAQRPRHRDLEELMLMSEGRYREADLMQKRFLT